MQRAVAVVNSTLNTAIKAAKYFPFCYPYQLELFTGRSAGQTAVLLLAA
jgi:hypothetical protein